MERKKNMIVYSQQITNRLRYICDFVGNEIIGKPFTITNNIEAFSADPGPRINYSDDRINTSDFWIQPHTLLFQKSIREQPVECSQDSGYTVFFKTQGDLPFDLFAACFYLLSRYEEYLPHQTDAYGRYAHQNSLAFREKFLDIPLINIWLQHFRERLHKRYTSLAIHQPGFNFLPTYDIDEAYSFKYKQWWRSLGATIRDLAKGKRSRALFRNKVLSNKVADPFDSFDWIDSINERYVLHPLYFFLVAAKTGKYDKNILPGEKPLQDLITRHAQKYSLGVHPSWQSFGRLPVIQNEIETLETISGQKIISSRQHFIKFKLPDTYRMLINAGILKDFSMGYGSINGFRASVASPFYWYDLENEQATSLQLHPFCYMEANSFFEQKFSPAQALEEMRHYLSVIKKVNGTLVTIWHNTFLGTDEMFQGWREVYEQFLEEAVK